MPSYCSRDSLELPRGSRTLLSIHVELLSPDDTATYISSRGYRGQSKRRLIGRPGRGCVLTKCKCVTIRFTHKRYLPNDAIYVGDTHFLWGTSVRYLGVSLDFGLTFRFKIPEGTLPRRKVCASYLLTQPI